MFLFPVTLFCRAIYLNVSKDWSWSKDEKVEIQTMQEQAKQTASRSFLVVQSLQSTT